MSTVAAIAVAVCAVLCIFVSAAAMSDIAVS